MRQSSAMSSSSSRQRSSGELPVAERSRLARAVLQLHQQQARAGGAPADVDQILAPFGLAGLSSAPGFEFAPSSKSSSESDGGADDQFADIQAELDAELGRPAADGGSSAAAAAAALSDEQKSLDAKTPAKLMPGIISGAFWLSKVGEGEHWLVYYRCSQCEGQHEELVSELGDLQVQKNLAAAADFKFVCEDCE